MKLGLLTAALPGMTLKQIAPWAAGAGYQMLEIACWPAGKAERRYAGVCHIDVDELTTSGAAENLAIMRDSGLEISSLAFYPNILDPNPEQSAASIAHLKKVIDAAVLLEVPIVGTFIGADQNKSAKQNLEAFAIVWPH